MNYRENISRLNLIKLIRSRMDRGWDFEVKHVWREGNASADCLARLSQSLEPGLKVFREPSENVLENVLSNDFIGLATPSLISL